MTKLEQRLLLHAFKAIALARVQIQDFDGYKVYEDEIIADLLKDLGVTNGNNMDKGVAG